MDLRGRWDIVPLTSTPYYTSASGVHGIPNLQLISADGVRFDMHYGRVFDTSNNRFNSRLPLQPPAYGTAYRLFLDEPAAVLTIVVRGMSSIAEDPGNDVPVLFDILSALDALRRHGIAPQTYLAPPSPIRSYLLRYTHRQDDAIWVYAFAADHGLEEIARTTSSHLLDFPLVSLSQHLCDRMGPLFFLRLAQLHERRLELLRNLILHEPATHDPNAALLCGPQQRATLTGAWASASAELVWQISPDLAPNVIRAALERIENTLVCNLCREQLRLRIHDVVREWSLADREIPLEVNSD